MNAPAKFKVSSPHLGSLIQPAHPSEPQHAPTGTVACSEIEGVMPFLIDQTQIVQPSSWFLYLWKEILNNAIMSVVSDRDQRESRSL